MTLQTGKRGFTLVELMVVIGIIIVIAATVLTVIPGLREKAQEKATRAFMERLETAIEQYYDDNRAYPGNGISNLKTSLYASDSALKQYFEFDDNETDGDNIVDQWGNPFVYIQPGTQNTTTYDLYSTGPDGVTGTSTAGSDPDDINNWSR